MRKAAEALNDHAMLLGGLQRVVKCTVLVLWCLREQAPIGRYRFFLHLADFAVLEWHVKEDALDHIQRAVGGRFHTGQRDSDRLIITGERARGASIDVARKLIEQD